jgi:hypothetical protein
MKALLISGLTLALLTGGAFAQASAQPAAPPAPGMAAPPPPPPGVTAAQPPAPPPGAAPAPPPPGGPEAGNDMDGPRRPLADPVFAAVARRRPRRPRPRISASNAATGWLTSNAPMRSR